MRDLIFFGLGALCGVLLQGGLTVWLVRQARLELRRD